MQIVRVSFFSELSVQSLTRRVFLPRVKRQALDSLICQMMQGPEFFACYHETDGGVVALDRRGVRVRG
jgi:hypothetical protein